MSDLTPPRCGLCDRTPVRIGIGGNRVNVCTHCDGTQCPNGHDVFDATSKFCTEPTCSEPMPAHIPRDDG